MAGARQARSAYDWTLGLGGALIRLGGGVITVAIAIGVVYLLFRWGVAMTVAIDRWAVGESLDLAGIAVFIGAIGGLIATVWPLVISSSRDRRMRDIESMRRSGPVQPTPVAVPEISPSGGLVNNAALGLLSTAASASGPKGAMMVGFLRRFEWPTLALLCAALVALVFFGIGSRLLIALALAGVAAFVLRAMWWPQLKSFAAQCKGWVYARADKAPAFWIGPAQNDDHAGMRRDYEALVTQEERSAADLLTIANLVSGLENYGDNPLAKPPTLRRQAMAALGVSGLAGTAVGRYLALGAFGVFLLMLAGLGFLWGQTQTLKAQRDAPCSARELDGHTSRVACRDLAEIGSRAAALEQERNQQAAVRAEDVAGAVGQSRQTAELNQRNRQREAVSEARRRRAQNDDVESVRDARAPNWDSRLRDLTDTPLPLIGPEPGAAAGAGSPSGVSGTGAGAPDLSDPDAGADADAGD